MPTGYTAPIYEGGSLTGREFILRCSRAFGAAVMQRDDPIDEPIKHRQPSTYHLDRLVELNARLKDLRGMTGTEAQALADAAYEEEVTSIRKRRAERAEMRKRYEATLAEVEAWEPPTHEHTELREFCIDQLRQSIDFDCNEKYERKEADVLHLTGEQWLSQELAKVKRDIAYEEDGWQEEQERVRKANEWIDQLVASL